jgi:hypothetical protein
VAEISAPAITADILKDYIPEPAFAHQIEKCLETVRRWRRARTGPAFTQIGMDVYYRREAIREWLIGREQQSGPVLRRRGKAA